MIDASPVSWRICGTRSSAIEIAAASNDLRMMKLWQVLVAGEPDVIATIEAPDARADLRLAERDPSINVGRSSDSKLARFSGWARVDRWKPMTS